MFEGENLQTNQATVIELQPAKANGSEVGKLYKMFTRLKHSFIEII